MGNKVPTMGKSDIGKLNGVQDAPPSAAREALRRTLLASELNTSRCTTSQELADRFDSLFQLGSVNGFIPNVEMLALASGWDRRTLWDIENGVSHKGDGMSDIIKRAKDLIGAAEAQLALSGDINATAYIFRAKNFQGMTDKQEVVVTPNNGLQEQPNAQQIIDNLPQLDEGKD